MADITKTLEIIFNGVDKGVSGTVDGITGKMTSLGAAFNTLDNIAEPFGKMADKVIQADLALGALTVAGLTFAYVKYKDLATAVAELDKVLGDNAEGLEAAKDNAYELSQTYGVAMTDIVKSTADFVQAGFSVEESMKLVKTSMDLSIAGTIPAAEASDYLVRTLKGFKAPAEDAGRLIDVLNEVSNKYATDVQQLATGMAQISPIAKQMGFGFEETAALLTPIIEVFGSGAIAADALKIGLLKLGDDAKPVTDALAALNIPQKDLNGNMRATKDILADVQAKFTTLTAEQKTFYAAQLVGLEQSPRMIEVFDGGAKGAAILADTLKAAGSASEEVAKQLATPQKQIEILIVSFSNLAEAVGEKFGKSATDTIKASNDVAVALQKALDDGSLDPLVDKLEELLDGIAAFLREFAKSLPEALEGVNFKPLTDALENLGGAVKGFFGDFDPKDPEKVKDTIQKVVDGLALLINTTKGMADTFAPIIAQIIKSIEDLSKAGTGDQELFGNILAAGKLVMDMGSQLVLALAAMHEWGVNAKDIFEVLGGSVKIVFNSLQAMFDQFVIAFLEGLIKLNKVAELVTFGKLGEEVKAATASLKSWRDAVGQDYEAQLKDIDDGLRMVGEGFGVTEEAAKTAGESMADFRKKVEALSEKNTIEMQVTAEGKDAIEVMGMVRADAEKLSEDPASIKVEVNPEYYSGALDLIAKFKSDADVTIETTANEESARKAAGMIKEIVGYTDDGLPIYLYTDVSKPSMDKAKRDLKDGIPTEKQIEIKLQGEIDKEMAEIKAKGEMAQSAFEWNAKLRIEEAKADADRLIESTKVLGSEITSIGDNIVKMFSVKWDDMPLNVYMEYLGNLKQQKELQKQAMDQQQKLMDQQTEYMRLKNLALQRGEVGIKIDSTGLEPSLEMIMWQILQKVQIRANEDSAAFLLGI